MIVAAAAAAAAGVAVLPPPLCRSGTVASGKTGETGTARAIDPMPHILHRWENHCSLLPLLWPLLLPRLLSLLLLPLPLLLPLLLTLALLLYGCRPLASAVQ